MADPKDRGGRMLANLLPLFSEEDRQLIQDKFSKSEAAIAELGKAALRQDDYSRVMGETQAEKARAQKWYEDNVAYNEKVKAREAEAERILAEKQAAAGGAPAGGGNGGGTTPDLTGFIKKSDVEELLNQRLTAERAAASAVAYRTSAFMAQLQVQHLHDFGEVLPQGELEQHCRTVGLNVDQGGYESFVREKRAAITQAAQEKALKEAEERGAARVRQEMSSAPYSLGAGGLASEEGTLSGLGKAKDAAKTDAVAAAVATYNAAVAAKKSA